MLIHIVRFVGQQNKVKQKVLKYFKEEVENHIRYGDPISGVPGPGTASNGSSGGASPGWSLGKNTAMIRLP